MKTRFYSITVLSSLLSLFSYAQKAEQWEDLFDGLSVAPLRGYKMETFPDQAWKIEDGALASQTGVPNVDFVTRESYRNFELVFEWKVEKAGNSGVFFHVQELATHESGNGNSPNWLNNCEMQILDDINFDDKEPRRSAGSLYDLIAPENKKLKPVGEYNEARLVVNKTHVEHWLNGTKVVQYEIGSNNLNKLISGSKFQSNPDFAKSTNGLIMFQHHAPGAASFLLVRSGCSWNSGARTCWTRCAASPTRSAT